MSIQFGGWVGFKDRGLAPRELECLLASANGCTIKEAAKNLGMAPSTAAKRIASVMFKLGVSRQPAMVAEAMKRGLIAPLMILLASFGGYQAATSLDSDHLRRGPSRRVVELRILKARDEAAQTV
nr:LuxR C-terminal-related transcriptional regulator [uncultured Pseudomonas sp.]